MSGDPGKIHFNGVLGRIEVRDDFTLLRCYPWVFDPDPHLKPVLEITFTAPSFNANDLKRFDSEEMDIEVSTDRAEVWNFVDEKPTPLFARYVQCNWVAFDQADYVKRIRQLDERLSETENARRAQERHLADARKLVVELVRRAEIKGAARPDLRQRESAVVDALQRVLTQLADR